MRDSRPLKYIKQKLRDWISDFWNQVDCVSYTLFISAIVTRFYVPPAQFELVYWLFSFSLLVYFIRFSQLFFVVEQLGPKIIMIKKMVSSSLLEFYCTRRVAIFSWAHLSPNNLNLLDKHSRLLGLKIWHAAVNEVSQESCLCALSLFEIHVSFRVSVPYAQNIELINMVFQVN